MTEAASDAVVLAAQIAAATVIAAISWRGSNKLVKRWSWRDAASEEARVRRLLANWAVAALAALIASELIIPGVGDWWAAHPSTGAFVSGALLTVVVLLIVDEVVKRALDDAAEKRWRPAGQAAAGAVLDAVALATRVQQRAIWGYSAHLNDPDQHPAVDMVAVTSGFAASVTGPVLAAAPVLTATESLHAMYDEALAASRAAAELEAMVQVMGWAAQQDPTDVDDYGLHPVELFWDAVAGPWVQFRERMSGFSTLADRGVGARVSGWDFEPWNESGSEDFQRWLDTETKAREPGPEDFG